MEGDPNRHLVLRLFSGRQFAFIAHAEIIGDEREDEYPTQYPTQYPIQYSMESRPASLVFRVARLGTWWRRRQGRVEADCQRGRPGLGASSGRVAAAPRSPGSPPDAKIRTYGAAFQRQEVPRRASSVLDDTLSVRKSDAAFDPREHLLPDGPLLQTKASGDLAGGQPFSSWKFLEQLKEPFVGFAERLCQARARLLGNPMSLHASGSNSYR